MTITVRPARTHDVIAIRDLVENYAGDGPRLLRKNTVTLYEDVQEFFIAELDGVIVGCGALHVFWHDLGEVRTLAVSPSCKGQGVGSKIMEALAERAIALGLTRLFCLTFEIDFFTGHGFQPIKESPVDASTYAQLLLSGDQGVAEFLDLEHVKPNTLGNTRMLKIL
ncbi:MAG: amino-acid N-acetyltransferase [Candidatus Nanopelagicales bacterium]|jgi:amino-acid N-acetyltransferase|nr:amino-acid N-acetyltransferase [Candidatus Nanopelagicales bacterium]MDP4666626.1 amino-acid N-acetyltransferase [Candidatus Nanopelagicales bacterium]MDP4895634.1 amino-acid N-acetyltransferase [Candidatus Nanopelagicales bacterium]MDP5050697.1 amino-acid N-acetyltransferase [Candidatus Nanopelagicales bacterium]